MFWKIVIEHVLNCDGNFHGKMQIYDLNCDEHKNYWMLELTLNRIIL